MCKYKIDIVNPNENIEIKYEKNSSDSNIEFINFKFSSKELLNNIYPIKINIYVQAINIHYKWNPKSHLMKALNLDWFNNLNTCNLLTGAPVEALLDFADKNKFTVALSDTLNTINFKSIVLEETAEYKYEIELFKNSKNIIDNYELIIRIDKRNIRYETALNDVAIWWENFDFNVPLTSPSISKLPMYSTWYSFHQNINETDILKQCRLSKDFNCKSIIIDDGWQTDENNRGYSYCGDWEISDSKIKNIDNFVSQIHNIGLNILFWFSVPFIGKNSKNYNYFKNKLIDPINDRDWYVLDPRYPDVREFIINKYETAIKTWKLDGLKLDFIDEFTVTPFSGIIDDPLRDFISIEDATNYLMKECINRLQKINKNVMIEFRQTYNGPVMRSFGNIFRAVDCPLDSLENRIRICDLRLLCKNSAVHSDMIMWNYEDTVESAALQFINIMFSVPQISMLIDKLSVSHKKMLKFYSELWFKYKNQLIDGTFIAMNPQNNYNLLIGKSNNICVCSIHTNQILKLSAAAFDEIVIINGTNEDSIHFINESEACYYNIKVFNCMGDIINSTYLKLDKGYNNLSTPRSGVTILSIALNEEFKQLN